MTILAFDTSAAHCAAALVQGDRVLAARAEGMTRGQAERLMPLLEALLAEAGVPWPALERIGVGIGPGNFTGIRIAVSAARGLALGLGIPAIGVSGFDAIAEDAPGRPAAIPAPRGQAYLRVGTETPRLVPAAEAGDAGAATPQPPEAFAVAIARIAARRKQGERPAPLYLRPADAAPARDLPPRILDDA